MMPSITGSLDRFREDFDAYTQEIQKTLRRRGSPVPCRAGCDGCCRGEVRVSEEEVGRVVASLPPAAYHRLAEQGPGVDPRTAVCPALDPVSRRCSIYAERPLICRGYMVINHPDICHPERVGEADVALIREPLLVILARTTGQSETTLRSLMIATAPQRDVLPPPDGA